MSLLKLVGSAYNEITIKRDNQQYIIMALNTSDDSFVFNHVDIKPIKHLIGSYKGTEENSYLLPANGDVLRLAKCYEQESIVKLGTMSNGKRKATVLDTISQRPLLTGDWVNVGTIKPDSDAWTYDIETGNYFIIEV